MITSLIQALATELQIALEALKVQTSPSPPTPGKNALPVLAVYPGKFAIRQGGREAIPAMKEVSLSQSITLGQPKAGPYPLEAPPRPDSLHASRVVAGKPPAPLASADFNVDGQQATISFPTSKTAAGNTILVEFASLQVSRQGAFQQELWLDAYAASLDEAEKWAGLACSVALNRLDTLLAAVNGRGPWREKAFSTATTVQQVQLVEGVPLFDTPAPGYRLKFTVSGELRFTQLFPDSPAVIQEVVIDQRIG